MFSDLFLIGFHGGMKRWGFHGMPDLHGVTKSHRRIGCIGSGRDKVPLYILKGKISYLFVQSRVWPGQKMPGNVGGKYRWACGLRVSGFSYSGVINPFGRCGVSTMMNLCSMFRALQYLAKRGTLCKSAIHGFLDTGMQWTPVSVIMFLHLEQVGGSGTRWEERKIWLSGGGACKVSHCQAGRDGGGGVESSGPQLQ